ncbi:MAG: threonine/serine dehydratase [Planctomycetota bacterium]
MTFSLAPELIDKARERLKGHIRLTPVLKSPALSRHAGAVACLKLESLQRGGSFKIRGAMNYVSELAGSGFQGGLVAASAGNHAQGVALAAREHGLKCHIVMPEGADPEKVAATQENGAEVLLKGANLDESLKVALDMSRDLSLQFVHPFEHPLIMAGQGTLGLEILEQTEGLGTVVIPVGGGGLAVGVATALKRRHPELHVVGVQAEIAPGMAASFKAGHIEEPPFRVGFADGISVKRPSETMLSYLRGVLDDIVTVSEESIQSAILMLLQRHRVIAEGAGAAAVAAVMEGKVKVYARHVCCVVSGGNIALKRLARLIEKA